VTLIAIDRADSFGEAWAVLYEGRVLSPDGEAVREFYAPLGLGWACPVVVQPCGDEPYPNVREGEVVLDHPDYGHVVVQAIDCDYKEEV
jgi:hypothetical protein